MQSIVYRFNEEIKEEYENVINVLETIKNIEINDKLCVNSNNILSVHSQNTYRSLVRWWYSYNRSNSLEYLENLYNNSISSLNSRLVALINLAKNSNKKKNRKARKRMAIIKEKISNMERKVLDSKKGIVNLMITYQKDDEIKKKLNVILDKIIN